MTQFSPERVHIHLRHLQDQIDILLECKNFSLQVLVQDHFKLYTAFHAFQLAIENVMDISGHILASIFHEPYDEYKQLLPMLERHKVLPADFVKRCSGIAEFRNKLVHGYLSVDPEKVHGYLTTELPLLSEFARHIVEFLERQKE